MEERAQQLSDYQRLQEAQAKSWEAQCCSCGACCGIKDQDTCEELVVQDNGKFFCRVYENRFGAHKTRSGQDFICVPIRDILHEPWPGDQGCAYKQALKRMF